MKKTWINFGSGSDGISACAFFVLCATAPGYDVAREWRLGTG